jgi:hypothetical protein
MKKRDRRNFNTQKGGRKMERVFAECIPTYNLGKKLEGKLTQVHRA